MNFAESVYLEGSSVQLEPLRDEHAASLAGAVTDGEIHRLWYTTVPSPEEMPEDVAARLEAQRAGRMASWVIVRRLDRRVVGLTSFLDVLPQHRRLEIGATWMARSAQRTGLNVETKLLLLRRAFDDLQCIAVQFGTHWHNRQSRRAIEALGAKQDGVLRSHRISADGSVRDTVIYSIIAAEWPAVERSLIARLDRAPASQPVRE